ncbi:AAA family ATPase [Parasphingorhabdus flavimaris]|uniref:AAA family ATPase n=1 Tax=Parasphingorhabdus flavimaris TaxID=266812 RepID=A0ABX2N4G4_9SPHN|nr:TOPRIM nucleotidyl transferase/hydrolase domain-containing protein [Parasphingorhabdus flavimaris]NVD28598.1 AAA family ATPase [Parasphingorhabdus flavimaris]
MPDQYIEKIHLKNFKGFRDRKVQSLDSGLNIFVGDNETGKSSILLAVELVLGANPYRVESIGLDRLLNQQAVAEFLAKDQRKFEDLPEMEIDIYLGGCSQEEFDGQANLEHTDAFGIYLRCRPRDDLHEIITQLISAADPTFPFEYYMIEIKGFSGSPITPYNKPINHLLIDNTQISNEHASRAYVRKMYDEYTVENEKQRLKYEYRQSKAIFSKEQFEELNKRIEGDYAFAVKSNSKANLETDLTIAAAGVDIENMGMGAQCFIRTEFALSKQTKIDVVLLEEPENHLSHERMKELVKIIGDASQSQVFVATHSSLICSRLDLRRAVFLGDLYADPIKLDRLSETTAKFFMKAPNSAVLEFALAKKCLLVEGHAEYMLIETFFQSVTGGPLSGSGVSVISVGGLSFPRFLEIAQFLGIKTAVVTDNDGDWQHTCVDRYKAFAGSENIEIFADNNNQRSTFEICLYEDNSALCDELFEKGRKTLSVQDYMLSDKAEVAYQLASNLGDKLTCPEYIKNAITWLNS